MSDATPSEITGCPACGSTDIRLVRRFETTEQHRIVAFRSGARRPTFVAEPVVAAAARTFRDAHVECVNGHAHPDEIGFDLEWAGAP